MMTLRKAMVLALVLSSLITPVIAQKDLLSVGLPSKPGKKFYYQMGIGYNLAAGTETFLNESFTRDGSSSFEYTQGSWGKGFDLAFGLGAKINKNICLELELGYLVGGKNMVENNYYTDGVAYPYSTKQTMYYKANTFRINPKFVFEAPFQEVNAFYTKIGYLIGFGKGKNSIDETWTFDAGGTGNGAFERELTGGLVSGSTMAIGVRLKAEEGVCFFMEVTGNNLHRTFEESIMTEAYANGESIIADIDTYYKNTQFVDKVTNTAGVFNPDSPRLVPSFRTNYSSAGFRLGFIKYF